MFIIKTYTTDSGEEKQKIFDTPCTCGCPMYHHGFTSHPAWEDISVSPSTHSTKEEIWVSQCVFCNCKSFKPVEKVGTRE